MNILKTFSNLWHGFKGKDEQKSLYIKCPDCGLIRPKTQANCECQESDDSPIIVEMINDEPGSLIAKLSLASGGYQKILKNLSTMPPPEDKNKITLIINSRTTKDVCYNVIFNNRNGVINIKCDCPAGELTKLCWHKLALVRGDSSMLADFCEKDDFRRVQEWLKKSSFIKLISDHDKAEKIVFGAQKILKTLKANIETAMRTGA